MTCLLPVSWTQYWNFSSSICSSVLLDLVVVAVHPLVVGVVLAPGLDRVAARVDQVGVGAVLVMPDRVAVVQQVIKVLTEVLADQHVTQYRPICDSSVFLTAQTPATAVMRW